MGWVKTNQNQPDPWKALGQLTLSHLGSLLGSAHQPQCDHRGSLGTHMAPGMRIPSRGPKASLPCLPGLYPALLGCTRAPGPAFLVKVQQGLQVSLERPLAASQEGLMVI